MFPPLMRADRIAAVASAAAHDLNDELTILESALQMALKYVPVDFDARPHLLDMQAALQRSSWKVSGLLNYTSRLGAQRCAATMERLIEEQK